MNKYLLVIGPSAQTRGGITSVIKAHKSTYVWDKWNCVWISSYIDRGAFLKITYFIFGYLKFLLLLPFSNLIHIHFSEKVSATRKNIFLITSKGGTLNVLDSLVTQTLFMLEAGHSVKFDGLGTFYPKA
ncbi:MAG: hypothetical protein EOM29_10490, partial [Bacteroidia bacterium]|nr:hypothetical protein [Bacteroidia bacterium]